MSDKPDIDIPAVIVAAVAAAGERDATPRGEAAWKTRVGNNIPHIVAMMGEGSTQFRIAAEVANAQVFTADYLGYEIEDSSTRAVVSLKTRVSEDHPDGIEQMRTHRTDGAQGRNMTARLAVLEKGDPILVWKAMEKMGNDRKVRVFVHFEKTWKKDTTQDRPREQVSGNQREAPQEEQAAAPAPLPLTDQTDTERLHQWREGAAGYIGQQGYARLVERLETKGYDINGVSEVEWDDVVRPIIREIRKDQQ